MTSFRERADFLWSLAELLRGDYKQSEYGKVILPNYGKGASPDGIRRVAEAAEELGFDSVWATEHIIVGPEAIDPYGRVYAPLVTLGWIAGWTEFKDRGRRADEAIRLMRALWSGERDFEGQFWSFHDATSQPHPSPQPEIWVGGSSERAIRRALELGDVSHRSRGSDAEYIRRVKEQHPELRVVPRVAAEHVDAMLAVGADGAVVQFCERGRNARLRRPLPVRGLFVASSGGNA